MESSSCASDSRPVEAITPHQPASFTFPQRQFGKKTVVLRSFQSSWFHYNEATDSVVCFLCAKAHREQKLNSKNADTAFVSC